MFKSIFITLFFSSTLIALTDQPNYSQQISNNTPSPTVPSSYESNPVCMMQRENGAIINLSSMCGKSSNLDNRNNEAAQQRARAIQRLNAVCRSTDSTDPEFLKLCKNGFPY